jgi:hypothetical protein
MFCRDAHWTQDTKDLFYDANCKAAKVMMHTKVRINKSERRSADTAALSASWRLSVQVEKRRILFRVDSLAAVRPVHRMTQNPLWVVGFTLGATTLAVLHG